MNRSLAYLLATSLALSGCVGPTAIKTERLGLGDAVARTGREQLLLNIIRVHNHEPPQFIDVSQVVNQSQLNGTITSTFPVPSGSANPITPGFTISSYDQPSITYTPLLGSALVAQIAQPITVDSIAALYDSGWPIGPLLTLTASRISPLLVDREKVINAIDYLARYGVLTVAAAKSPYTSAGTQDDALVLFVDLSEQFGIEDMTKRWKAELPKVDETEARELKAEIAAHRIEAQDADHVIATWNFLKQTFAGTYIVPTTIGIFPAPHAGPVNKKSGSRSPNEYSIELRAIAATQPTLLGQKQVIPPLRTRSALGVLMMATEEPEYIKFMTQKEFVDSWIYNRSNPPEFVVDPTDLPADDSPSVPIDTFTERIFVAATASGAPSKRHFIGIIHCKERPPEDKVYAITVYRGEYYFILRDDVVSQRNFALIGQLLTMQSTTSTSPAPTPTISVGGH